MEKQKLMGLGLIILLVVGIILISGCVQEESLTKAPTTTTKPSEIQQSTTNFLTYENPAYGIRIKYPSDWIKQEPSIGIIVGFISPEENSADLFYEGVNIVIEDLPSQQISLEKYKQLSIAKLKKTMIDFNVADFNFIDSTDAILSGYPAYKITYTTKGYTGEGHQCNFKYLTYCTIKNNKAYSIVYAAEEDKYSKYLGIVNEMIDSFEIE